MLFFDNTVSKSTRLLATGLSYALFPTITKGIFIYKGGKSCYELVEAAFYGEKVKKELGLNSIENGKDE